MSRMKMTIAYKRIIPVVLGVLFLFLFLFGETVFAGSVKDPDGKNYETHGQNADDAEYNSGSFTPITTFAYGKSSLGKFQLVGDFSAESTVNGFVAYGTDNTISMTYSYDGSYQTETKTDWNIISDESKMFNGNKLSKKIGEGTIIVQKSYDRSNWQDAITPLDNVFHKRTSSITAFYSLDDADLLKGCYYRITVLYEMRKQIGTEGLFNTSVFDYDKCMEVYEFYACYNQNPVILRDVLSGADVSAATSVGNGFVIDKCGSSNTVTVKWGNSKARTVANQESICAAGKYIVEIKNALGTTFQYNISVADGLEFASLKPTVFENGKKDEYSEVNPVTNTSMGIPCHTTIKIAQKYGTGIDCDTSKSVPGYGITGQNVYLLMDLVNEDTMSQNGWEVIDDNWGEKDKETIAGARTGKIASGVIVIQTSVNGQTWANVKHSRYANGLYTTDYETNYGNRGDVLIYTPDGSQVLKGLYIRVYYAYEAYQKETKSYCRELERYTFYLCNNELGAVTLHNLSLDGQELNHLVGDDDEAILDMYRHAETMTSGAGTVTGFQVDTKFNPTVTYTITRNGQAIAVASEHKYTETGKYVITLKSAVGKEETRIIYVDRESDDNSLKTYFGKSFIQGKRIYSENLKHPVFEGGKTTYNLAKLSDNYLPISGTIKNVTTGKKINISSSRAARSAQLDEAGEYLAEFTTNPQFESNDKSGDVKKFTFRFRIIEKGTAPGPVVNERRLNEYDRLEVTDSYPTYYGVTYQSASYGRITLAFRNRKDAFSYAYNYEKGMVERQENGTFRYNGTFQVAQKEKYNSEWDITDAMNYFAEEAVQDLYFDLTEEFTYRTLPDEIIKKTNNLRTLELKESVVIFADDQKEALTDKGVLPIINDKIYRYLIPGPAGLETKGTRPFEFVKDKYECDSSSIIITDCKGDHYDIEYRKSVGQQLAEYDCPTGIITITERTVYGDENEYEAVYIRDGDATTSIDMEYYLGKDRKTISVSSNSLWDEDIVVDAFSITDIKDELDPCALVVVSYGKKEYSYAADQMTKDAWSEPGEYTVHVVNRMGYGYDFKVNVQESEYATIMFDGYGTENTQAIVARYGEESIGLPTVAREGYEFVGFEDSQGNRYKDVIDKVDFKGSLVLTSVWDSKKYTLTLRNGDQSEVLSMRYGEECDLPIPESEDGLVFKGWMLDGEILPSNKFILEKEGDVELVASFSEATETEGGESFSVGEKKHRKWPIIIFIIACGGVVGAVYKNRKKAKTSTDSADNETGLESNQNVDITETENKNEGDSEND